MINRINKGYEAIELISKNSEYEKSIKLLKESFIECDEVYDLFIRQFQGEINKAVENCDPNNRDVMYIKSLLLDTQGAVLFLERCLQVYPNEAIFYQRLSCLYNSIEYHGKSIELISRALELDNNPRWFYYKAKPLIMKLQKFFYNSKDINECFKWYAKYLESNPSDDRKVPEAYFSLAFLYSLKEDKENARVYFYKAFVAEKNRLECFEQVGDNYLPKLFAQTYLMSSIDKCGQCMKSNPKFKCPCLLDAYCDKKCQKAHWSIHKIVCKKMKGK